MLRETLWIAAGSLAIVGTVTAIQAAEGSTGIDCRRVEGDPEAVAAIGETFLHWREAMSQGDIDGLVALVAEDAEFWSHGQAPIVGRAALREAFSGVFSRFTLEQDFECVEVIAADDWALVRGTEVNRLTPKSGGDPAVQRQRAFSVLRREPDGVWRFARGMTNTPPAGEAAQAGDGTD